MQNNYVQEKPLGYFQAAAGAIDTSTLVSAITGASAILAKGAVVLRIVAEAQAVRWRDDGTAPTATVGQPLAVGTELVYTAASANLRFISQTAGAVLNVTVYGHTQFPG